MFCAVWIFFFFFWIIRTELIWVGIENQQQKIRHAQFRQRSLSIDNTQIEPLFFCLFDQFYF